MNIFGGGIGRRRQTSPDGRLRLASRVLTHSCKVQILARRNKRRNGMIELKFEYFRSMEEVVEALIRNGYKVTIEDLIDKRPKHWKHLFLLTAEKAEPKEITDESIISG